MPSFFFLRELAGFHHRANARRIHGARLLDECVFAGFNRGLEMSGAEMRRRGEDDVIDLWNREQFLVGVETSEAVLRRDADAEFAQVRAATGDPVREKVRERDHADVLVGEFCAFLDVFGVIARFGIDHFRLRAERIEHRAAAASAAANHPDANWIIRRGMAGEDEGKLAHCRRACGHEG